MKCRFCNTSLEFSFLDLGFSPPSNAYLQDGDLNQEENYYPLRVKVCGKCLLAQTEDYVKPDKFFNSEYTYLSSTSRTWLEHARLYSHEVIQRFNLNKNSLVVEIASNDGYLLKNFLEQEIPCLGIEPAINTALIAESLGIPVLKEFFTESLAATLKKKSGQADLIIGNNVFAHVPDINDFSKALKVLLKPEGVATLEFPHIMNLIEENQFDTVYHEHYSYLSLYAVKNILGRAGLEVWDAVKLPTHGGSLRIYIGHRENSHSISENVNAIFMQEKERGLHALAAYESLQKKAEKVKNDLMLFLIEQKNAGKLVVAYGAAAKGNTLLNYAGVKKDLLPYVCDAASSKQGKYMPGSHIPIYSPEVLNSKRPDYILVLPWNLVDEVSEQLKFLLEQGTRLVTAVPDLKIH